MIVGRVVVPEAVDVRPAVEPPVKDGDFNGDGAVDITDLTLLQKVFNEIIEKR